MKDFVRAGAITFVALLPFLLGALVLVWARKRKLAELAFAQKVQSAAARGTHNCSHQRNALIKCAAPSCPDGVSGRVYRVTLRDAEHGIDRRARLKRVINNGQFCWVFDRYE